MCGVPHVFFEISASSEDLAISKTKKKPEIKKWIKKMREKDAEKVSRTGRNRNGTAFFSLMILRLSCSQNKN